MAGIFGNKQELESLQIENVSLKSKIETYEVRLSIKNKGITELTKQLDAANEMIDSLNDKLSKSISLEDFAIMKKNCLAEIESLEERQGYLLCVHGYAVEQTIARLRREAETRVSRAMANQTEQEKKAEKLAFQQYLAMLDDFEDWLYERKFGQHDNYYEDEDYGYDDDEDEWER